jgi:hypothetical protein
MLRFMYERDYRLPSDDAPRPLWIHFDWHNMVSRPLRSERELQFIEQIYWDNSMQALQVLDETNPDILQVCTGINQAVDLINEK